MRALLKAVAIAVALVVAGGAFDPAAAADTGSDELTLVALINEERARAGVAPLELRGELFDSSRTWSAQLAASGVLAHDDAYFGAARPAGARTVAENVGYAGSAEALHAALMASPGHRANILNPAFNVVGVGEVEANGLVYATQRFASMASPGEVVTSAPAKKTVKKKAAKRPRRARGRRR